MEPQLPSTQQSSAEAFGRKHRTGVVTLLFTDMVGSTALKRSLGDKTAAELFGQHQELIRTTLQQFQGEEIEKAGDSFLLIFATPSDATKFALSVQARSRTLGQGTENRAFDRIGIHVGEVVLGTEGENRRPKDLFGIQIDTCSRVMSLAQGGQILMSRAVFDSARQVLKGEDIPGVGSVEWLNHGPYLLKGLDEPIEICEVREHSQHPIGSPTASDKAQRQVQTGEEPVLGWRPGVEQQVPGTRWILRKKLGEGGFGEVWLGRNLATKEARVFKFCFQAERVRFLKRELTLFRLLKERIGEHKNIVRLHDVYLDQPPFYVERDYVEGADLRTWCREHGGPFPFGTRLEIIAEAGEALQAAHDAGIIHRDIKPGNILIAGSKAEPSHGDDRSPSQTSNVKPITVKLTDFGIGQVISREALIGITRAGFTDTVAGDSSSKTGTQLYMAPELLAGQPASPRSDIYSLGVVLFQMLVGDFSQPVTTDWWKQVLDPLLREDLEHCFAGNPQDRFAGAGELAKNLRALSDRRSAVEKHRAEQAARERAAYRRGVIRSTAVALLVMMAVLALAAFAFHQSREARAAARDLRRSLYAAGMHLALQAYQDGNLSRTLELINAHRAKPGEEDLRGFEWRYLWRLCQEQSLCIFTQHSGQVFSVASAPNGRLCASAGADNTVRIWDLGSRREIATLRGHTNQVYAVAFSSDGGTLASGSQDGMVILWNIASARAVRTLIGEATNIWCLSFSPDGKTLATGGSEAVVRLWDLRSYRPMPPLEWQKGNVFALRFSPDGNSLAVAGYDPSFDLWDFRERRKLATFTGHTAHVRALAFSPDGKFIASGANDNTVRLWTADTQRELARRAHGAQVFAVAFSSDGKLLASGSLDNSIKLWNTEGIEELTAFLGHRGPVDSVAFSADNDLLVSGSSDSTIRLWDVQRLRTKPRLMRQSGWVTGISFSRDGQTLVSGDLLAGNINFWDLTTMRRTETFSNASDRIVSAAFLRGEQALLVRGIQSVTVRERTGWKELLRIPCRGTALSTDGKLLVSANYNESMQLWDLEALRQLVTLQAPTGRVSAMHFSPDNKLLFIGTEEGIVQVQNLRTRSEPVIIRRSGRAVNALAVSPDGGTLAIGNDATLELWGLPAGQPLLSLKGHTASIYSVGFSPDGKTIATGSTDATAKLWNVLIPEAVATLRGHTGPVSHEAFSPDGDTLATASGDGTIRLWRATPFSEISALEGAAALAPRM